MFYPVSATPSQFKWLAGQLKSCRAVIAMSQSKGTGPLFGLKLAVLSQFTDHATATLCSQVNTGMFGFPMTTLSSPVWQMQFQYRTTVKVGIKQFPTGDLYIPAMRDDLQLVCVGLPFVEGAPITSLIFRLDARDRTKPRWLVEPHQNRRPPRTSPSRRRIVLTGKDV